MGSCCAPPGHGGKREVSASGRIERRPDPTRGQTPTAALQTPAVAAESLIRLPGGTFAMGTADRDANRGDGEGPVREVELPPFRIGASQVTNREFDQFVSLTGYRTGAERFGWSFVFASFLPAALRRGAQRPDAAPWWCRVDGATWRAPEGPGSDVATRADHPAVHVDHGDALAYCAWAGLRLPTEAEWEYAARGGLHQARYPWGDELAPGGQHRCNIWRGRFPTRNTAEDGFAGTCPVEAFPPNGFGIFGTSGNVWEWCADWWSVEHGSGKRSLHNPAGPAAGQSRVMRGGSYLCHDSYCNRYRVAARTSNDPDSSSGNVGFRCAADG
ncbi:formylglycine-generating enzyme family protein [Leekyejoonella antrihumi]|uniref:Formylglycine-generating enzyme family protein n=2 Tax=Leekyejoonella antrihumi TaxID=1660198 RepID=A0A563DV73_9MICO|nr:formylglycine-generating enzyme family protein [Leekyejoonella antrihumi]